MIRPALEDEDDGSMHGACKHLNIFLTLNIHAEETISLEQCDILTNSDMQN